MQKASPPLKLQLFGPFRLESEHGIISLPRRKTELLLAYLALFPRPVSREKLASLFWGDVSDAQARASLRNALAILRGQLGDLLITDRETVGLDPNYPLIVDVREFERITNQADAGTEELKSACTLYTDDLLGDFYEDWILVERERLRKLHYGVLSRLTQELRAGSQYQSAIEYAKQALKLEPADEQLHQHLMFCYMAVGDHQAALGQFKQAERSLQTALAIDTTPQTRSLYEWIRQRAVQIPAHAARLTNLPIPLTSFIGRTEEEREVTQLVAQSRLVTLSGVGGTGKTRLAIQSAGALIDHFKDGVWWVDLTAILQPDLVPQEVCRALGVSEQDILPSLVEHLQHRQLLLVLDNCEHLIDACAALVHELLSRCAHLHLLTTSREPLNLPGESVWAVGGLRIPQSQSLSLETLKEYESIRLLTERGREVRADFVLTNANASAASQIVRRLDGIPLAVELAAASVNTLTLDQIAARLDARFDLLTKGSRTALPRHQTLSALIDWSFDLLTEPQQILFRRLSIFKGGFTLEAAESVCSGEGIESHSVLNLLRELVSKSLVIAQSARFRMLETILAYASHKLQGANETISLSQRHRDFFLHFAEGADQDLRGPRQIETFAMLDHEQENLRAAIQGSLDDDAEAALRFGAVLWWYWFVRNQFHEGVGYLRRMVERAKDLKRTTAFVRTLNGLWFLEGFGGMHPPITLQQEALEHARALGDKKEVALALFGMGTSPGMEEYSYLDDSLTLWKEAGDSWGIGFVLNSLGERVRIKGDYELARAYYEESLMYRVACGDTRGIAVSSDNLGFVYIYSKEWEKSLLHFQKALRLRIALGTHSATIQALMGFAYIAAHTNRMDLALQLWAVIEEVLAGSEEKLRDNDLQQYEDLRAMIQAASNPETASLPRLSFEQAIDLILSMKP